MKQELAADLKAYSLAFALMIFFPWVTVNSWFNSLLIKANHPYVINIIGTHEHYMRGEGDGCNLQRRIIPELAQGATWIIDHVSPTQKLFQLMYGRYHTIPHLLFGYEIVHLFFGILGVFGIFFLFRWAFKLDFLQSFVAASIFSYYQTFSLTGFITGRWTDIASPAFFVWTFYFLLQRKWVPYFVLLALYAAVREIVVVFLVFLSFQILFEKLSKKSLKQEGPVLLATGLIILSVRLVLAKLFPGVRYCAHGDTLLDAVRMSIPWNLHDINQFKMPIFMDNLLLVFAWFGWQKKTNFEKALLFTGISVHLIHFITVPSGENYGRDFLATQSLLIVSLLSLFRQLGTKRPVMQVAGALK